ncbi:DUF4435 domain-containing protein [Halomonas sp. CnH100-B]|uniref:DUF4435 domain-containing protein n=1 Tax=Halomonas sp. CnH100-B TaxID=2954490 RepID=UPI002097EDDA|nr:DUF4435 domain-containing protein [Halomonas sp. CnH100-B]MCO7228790.1 DUF4435 domain-containing protein [Halomonas sp. CnH100-B]
MALNYSIAEYIIKTRMSSKVRVLVEGADDMKHFKNLLHVKLPNKNIKVDTAEGIRGDCRLTGKNNKEKILKVHRATRNTQSHNNLFFLLDREFDGFELEQVIRDLKKESLFCNNMLLTAGHSFENYFFYPRIIKDAYLYLCLSEFKRDAMQAFISSLDECFRILAAISLAAKDIQKSTYPIGTIHWFDFKIENSLPIFGHQEWLEKNNNGAAIEFVNRYLYNYELVSGSELEDCIKVIRGHTGVIFFQRIFAAYLKLQASADRYSNSNKHADDFSKINEKGMSAAFCEAWIRLIEADGRVAYPEELIKFLETEA